MWLLSACMGTVLRWVCLMIPILGTNTGVEERGGSPRRWRDLRRGRRRSRRGYGSRAGSRASQASNVGERNWTSVWPSSPGRPASRRSARRRRYGVQEVRRRRGRRDGSGNGILGRQPPPQLAKKPKRSWAGFAVTKENGDGAGLGWVGLGCIEGRSRRAFYP